MSIRKRDVHFSDWTKVRHALVCNNVQGITETSSFDDVRAFLINSESGSNPFYYYVCYIKETKEIYTHGQFYDCLKSGDSVIPEKIEELESTLDTKVDLTVFEELKAEVNENEKVAAKAFMDLNERKLDKSELDNIDLSNYVDWDTYYNNLNTTNSSINLKADKTTVDLLQTTVYLKANQADLDTLSAEVEENEEVTAAALTELHENKADKSEIPDVSNLVTKNEFNILSAEIEEKVDSTIFTTLSETVSGHTTNINNLSDNKADKTDLEDYAKKDDLNTKQEQLVSGTNIKTVNGNSILGSGNIETPDTKVTSADNHYGYDANNAVSTTGAFVTKITKDAANHVTSFESRALISTDIPELDASKITSGEISIDRLPKGALERLFVVESEAAAISATVQEGDVVQVTGNNNKMYFCISNTATTFATKFKEFTAGTATSVPWSGVTGKPTGIDGWGDRIGVIESGYATQSWVGDNYLSKNGGKIIGKGDYAWVQLRLSGNIATIMFEQNEVEKGCIGWMGNTGIRLQNINEYGLAVTDSNVPIFYWGENGSVQRILLHAGNYSNLLAGGTINGSLTATSFIGNLTGNADSANVLAKTYIENINYGAGSKMNLICHTSTWESDGFPVNYTAGLSVMTNYVGWQLVSYGGQIENPYFRSLQDNGTWKAWRQLAFLTDNVASATKLATPRTIWGQSFDGTGNINGAIDVSSVTTSLNTPVIKFASNCYLDMYGNYVLGKSAGSFSVFNESYLNVILHVLKDGNVAIGGKTADEKLHIYGNVKASGSMYAVDFATTSDNRLKDFVSDIYVDFESIKQIPKKYYYWKDKSMGKDLQLGTSAQELAKIYPECVHYDETNDRYSVNYQKLSIVALAAIDKLHDRVSELESKLYDKNN